MIFHRRKAIGLVLGLLLFGLAFFLPPPGGLSPQAFRMAGVTLLMACWWISEAAPIAAVSLAPLVLFPLLGILSIKETAAQYGDHLVFLFMGGFMIAVAMEKSGLHRRIALGVIRVIGAGPRRIILGFMIATAFLSMWISNTATAMMMLPIAMAVVNRLALEKGEEVKKTFGLALMLGVAYASSIGGIATLIGTPPNIVFSGFFNKSFPDAPPITFAQWIFFGFPLAVVLLPIAWVIIIRAAGGKGLANISFEGAGQDVIEEEQKNLGRMSQAEKQVLAVFCLAAVGWIFREPIDLGAFIVPGWSTLFSHPDYLSDGTVAMTFGLLLFFLPTLWGSKRKNLKPEDRHILTWEHFERNAPWGILLLFGGGFAIAKGFTATGLAQWIGQNLEALSAAPGWVMVLILCLVMTFLTEVTSNTATATMIMPILAAASVGMGIHPLLLMIPAAVSASCAFMLPVATPPNAIVFGSGWVTIPAMAKAGLLLNLIGAVVVTLMVYLLAVPVFGIDLAVLPAWVN